MLWVNPRTGGVRGNRVLTDSGAADRDHILWGEACGFEKIDQSLEIQTEVLVFTEPGPRCLACKATKKHRLRMIPLARGVLP